MWGTRGPSPPAAAMVGYCCVGWCWPLGAYVSSTYCRNSKNCLRKYFFIVDPIHSWHLTRQLNKEDLDLCTWAFRCFLCPFFYSSTGTDFVTFGICSFTLLVLVLFNASISNVLYPYWYWPNVQICQYQYWHHLMPVPVMYHADTGTGPKCINANTGTGTI